MLYFSYFCSKHRPRVLVRTIPSIHNLCFKAKISNNEYPFKPQFYDIKVGCKEVFNTRACYHDELECSEEFCTGKLSTQALTCKFCTYEIFTFTSCYAPNFEKSGEHIAFSLSVHPSVPKNLS